ncbi:CDP-alcohol phosphatidyltransferase [Azorhizobium oxalatiphilum]|uniref:CDP-alcohol phosphatidyltransferase n=1 Tax=Azorhizobium oxalatiphilum TaxID=980631 RepID=A0A917BWK0_9HYPH|nr:CDP-alcohol phosphatidyltransferase family protein [Azorhizobium oxalatiphilum]GGF59072.1 CDP-alcohol phosphatidyltransferase [Azorhizobium oxalatiphilum]
MTIYALKPAFQGLLRPLVHALAGLGVTANQVTLAAMAGSILVGAVVGWLVHAGNAGSAFLIMPVFLFVRMALNAVDGMLAREHGQKSDLGAFLNELGDVVSDAALYAPFALVSPFGPLGVGLFIVLAIVSEFAGVTAQSIGAPRGYEGPLGKSDRAFVLGALALWVGLFGLPGWIWPLPWLLSALLLLTIRNRIVAALGHRRAAS